MAGRRPNGESFISTGVMRQGFGKLADFDCASMTLRISLGVVAGPVRENGKCA